MIRILFYLDGYPHDMWRAAMLQADANVDFRSYPDWGSPDDGPAYAFVWQPEAGLLKKYTNIQAIFSLGAGIDHILADPELPDVPIIRMGDDGLKEGMAEYVLMNVLMHHRQMPLFLAQQHRAHWQRAFSKPASHVRVGIMGYGSLGKCAASALRPLGYPIATWSNSAKAEEENTEHFTGPSALEAFLARTDILVGLLPETKDTKGLLDDRRLAILPKGSAIISAGRGSLIDLDALHSHLNSGHLSGVTLDVVPEEPLADDHWLWHHPAVIITPHVAAITRADSAARYILENIQRLRSGRAPDNMLDKIRGY